MNKKYKYVAKQSFAYFKDGFVGYGYETGQEISEEDVTNIAEYLIEKIEIEEDK